MIDHTDPAAIGLSALLIQNGALLTPPATAALRHESDPEPWSWTEDDVNGMVTWTPAREAAWLADMNDPAVTNDELDRRYPEKAPEGTEADWRRWYGDV